MKTQTEKVIEYYNKTKFDYDLLWTGKIDHAMHYGYYDSSVKSQNEALLKMNYIAADYAHVKETDKVLDAGCGVGGSSIWLAENIGCTVVGLSVVSDQIKAATILAKSKNLESKVVFLEGDYDKVDYPDNSFDVVWFMESFCHSENKEATLKEAFRLLRKGGLIMISDYVPSDNLNQQQTLSLKELCVGWEMPDLPTENNYSKLLNESGFSDIVFHDISKNTRKNRWMNISRIVTPLVWFLRVTKLIDLHRYFNFRAFIQLERGRRNGWVKAEIIIAYKK